MAIAPGYEHDLFVSYAHVDDVEVGGSEGWVSQFVKRLESALRQRLGGTEALRIFFDSHAAGANLQLPELVNAVRRSALFLVVGSPSYATRSWPRQELDAFLEHADQSRLFMIECLPLNEDEHYPHPLTSHIHLEFWKPSGKRRIPMPYSPLADSEEFQSLVHSLAADIRNRLLSLRLLPAKSALTSTSSPGTRNPATRRLSVFIAQGTDDVEDEIDQLKRYLSQYEEEVGALPQLTYPQGGEAFLTALSKDLVQCALFVQILGRRAGRVPPDLPEGYTLSQLNAAKAAGIPIMQWRHPDLDLTAISDSSYVTIVSAETVVACGFEAFKRQVLDWLRRPALKARAPRSSTVFINADDRDLNIAKEIERECLRHALTTILPMSGPSSEANRKDLADNLTDCDVLLFIYGDTTQDWIRSQLRFFNKIKQKREMELRVLAICSGPPAEKPDIGMTVPSATVISCPDGWNMEPIRTLLSGVTE
jgi:hypothetical protein